MAHVSARTGQKSRRRRNRRHSRRKQRAPIFLRILAPLALAGAVALAWPIADDAFRYIDWTRLTAWRDGPLAGRDESGNPSVLACSGADGALCASFVAENTALCEDDRTGFCQASCGVPRGLLGRFARLTSLRQDEGMCLPGEDLAFLDEVAPAAGGQALFAAADGVRAGTEGGGPSGPGPGGSGPGDSGLDEVGPGGWSGGPPGRRFDPFRPPGPNFRAPGPGGPRLPPTFDPPIPGGPVTGTDPMIPTLFAPPGPGPATGDGQNLSQTDVPAPGGLGLLGLALAALLAWRSRRG